jgi:hypothetical protein
MRKMRKIKICRFIRPQVDENEILKGEYRKQKWERRSEVRWAVLTAVLGFMVVWVYLAITY